jgi:cation transport ATPase
MFTHAQGLQYAQKGIEEFEKRLNEINPEFLRLKEILNMSPEEKEKFIAEEKKKEAQAKKEKAARKAAKEAEEEKKSKLYWMGIFVWLITLISLCGITLALDEFLYIEGWMVLAIFIGGIIIVKYAWKAAKKALKRK